MKIVNFEEFVKMPKGTIFAPWEPCSYCGEFEIKLDTGNKHQGLPGNWYFNGTCPIIPHCDPDKASTFEFYIYDGSSTDYIDYKQFAIMDESDIDNMIKVLLWAKNGCENICDVPGLEN